MLRDEVIPLSDEVVLLHNEVVPLRDQVMPLLEGLDSGDDALGLSELGRGLELVRLVDGYIDATQPFKLAKVPGQEERVAEILYACAETLRLASLRLWPVMPGKMEGVETMVEISGVNPNTPIIVMSGGGMGDPHGYLRSVEALGAYATLAKPFERQELLAILEKLKAETSTS